MRILILTHFFPPGHLGGTEVLTLGLAKSLITLGHAVHVVCAEDWESAPSHRIHASDDLYEGIPVHRLHFNWTKAPEVFKYLYDNPLVYEHITEFIKEFQPDIVHITSCYSLSGSVVPAVKSQNLKIVLSATDFWFLCSRNTILKSDLTLCSGPFDPWQCAKCLMEGTRIYEQLRKIFPEEMTGKILKYIGRITLLTNQRGFRGMLGDWGARFQFLIHALEQVDLITTASYFLRAKFNEFGIPEEKIFYSAYGLNTTWARGFETKRPEPHLRLGFIGQIIPMKGLDILIRAVRSIPHIPLQLRIYGDLQKSQDYGKQLLEMAAGDDRISFLGTFDNSEMGYIFQEIDVLVVPSIWYDFPLVIPSAFATRTPVIATDLPGMNELVAHEQTGFLFDREDWEGLASLITKLSQQPEVLEQMRTMIPAIKTTDEMALEYEAYYRSLGVG
jgi:glycosyltransferase involved in cell wall biosynthesis